MKILAGLLLSVFISFSTLAQAEGSASDNGLSPKRSPHNKGTLSSLKLGARFSSVSVKRGVIFYNDFQIDPALSVFMFDDRLEFWGDTLSYRDFIYEDKVRFRTRISTVSDDPLFPAHASVKSNQPDRPTTYEFINSVELFFPGYNDNYAAELDLTYYKDISRHHGNYFDVLGKIKLTDFYFSPLDKKVEPNLVFGVGFGDKPHNQYYYGPDDDSSGFTNYSCGVWLAFPEEADRFFPIVQFTYFSVAGDHRQKLFAANNNQGFLASVIYSFNLLD